MPSMYQGVPYIASQGIMKGRIRAISRHMEGQESNELGPCQGKLQKDLDYAHIPMYVVIGVKPAYVRGYWVKIRVYHFLYSFRDDQGDINDKIWSMGSKESAAGQGKAIQSVIHLVW